MAQQKRRTIKKKEEPKVSYEKDLRKKKEASLSSSSQKEISFIVLIASALLLILGIYTDWIGSLGSGIAWLFKGLFGVIAYIIPFALIAAGLHIIRTLKKDETYAHVYIGGLAFLWSLSGIWHLFSYSSSPETYSTISDIWNGGIIDMGGGALGAVASVPLYKTANVTGACLILITVLLVSFIIMTDFAITRFFAGLIRKDRSSDIRESEDFEEIRHPVVSDISNGEKVLKEKPRKKRSHFLEAALDIVPKDVDKPKTDYIPLPHAIDKMGESGEPSIKIYNDDLKQKKPLDKNEAAIDPSKAPLKGEPADIKAEGSEEAIVKPKRLTGEIPVEVKKENVQIPYKYPKTDLLIKLAPEDNTTNPATLRDQAAKLVETLKSFNIEVKVLEISKGPSVTRFELQPTAGIRVSRITSLSDDIALSLAATAVRIEAPIPGKAAIGIEIPNSSIATVSIRDVLEAKEFKESASKLSCALGRDIAGKCIVGDISKMPHLLIAGATGSGKSVCINALIASILFKADPNEVKLIMIDPKVVELSEYNGIPHLLIPVVTDPRKAAGALNWAVQEMTSRYKFFADNTVRDIKGYNALMKEQGNPLLPQIVIIIDELADLMMVAPKDVESYVCRLAQLARAAGMHLVIATQRPSVDVITGVIKANIPSRIAFAVSSYVDSRTILDAGGAEKLLGRGDMLFYPMGASKPVRIQGAYISDDEVERLVKFVKKDSQAVYDEDILEKLENQGDSPQEEDDPTDADTLLPKAIEIVIDAGQASVSLVQRRLSVGYSRAGRLVDQMEERGIIGPHEGSKPRSVLVTRAEYLSMLQNAASQPQKNDSEQIKMDISEDEPTEDLYIPGEKEEEEEDDIIIMPPEGK
ncbi:MAG: DNA translocase FtsK [Bacillota bacterium]|nr:DNA translocase FtsK [Bacillota bacterium]